MKEFKPFSVARAIQGEQRAQEVLPESPVEVFPILTMSPFGNTGVRDFRPLPVDESLVITENDIVEVVEVIDEGDAGPKVVTSSVIDSASGSESGSELTSMQMHPSTQSPDPATPASVEKASNRSSEPLETKNDGWPLPPALG